MELTERPGHSPTVLVVLTGRNAAGLGLIADEVRAPTAHPSLPWARGPEALARMALFCAGQ